MKITGFIPSRYGSTRFPGKPLVMIDGKSMIQRVYEQALKCPELSSVIIATDSDVIEKHVRSFNGNVVMTSEKHNSGTERCNEVVEKLGLDQEDPDNVIINIQGDEPFIDPGQITELASLFADKAVKLGTLARKIDSSEELGNPNVVKVIFDKNSKAIYFSRFPVPYFSKTEKEQWIEKRDYYKHVGIYGYRCATLREISRLPQSSLEKAESLEQLRWIENGYAVYVKETEYESIAVDVPEDLLKITNRG
jgi:3-deoxy-manno-octulosonate cytidylyltransferase (CMP-KDO synthetase)